MTDWRARHFLMCGWARAALHNDALRKEMQEIVQLRPQGRVGILVDDDVWALAYQLRSYRVERIARASGAFGIVGQKRFDKDGFHESTPEELEALNKDYFQRSFRSKAHKARQVIRNLEDDPYYQHCERQEQLAWEAEHAMPWAI